MKVHHKLSSENNWFVKKGFILPGDWESDFKAHPDIWQEIETPRQWQLHPEFKDYFGAVTYATQFSFTAKSDRQYFLRFNGVFYSCRVYLNSHYLGGHEGYFDPFELPLANYIQEQNTLMVEVFSGQEIDLLQKQMIAGVLGHWDCRDPQANAGGIWQPVDIISRDQFYLSRLNVYTKYLGPEIATLDIQYTITSPTSVKKPANSLNRCRLEFTITAPDGKTEALQFDDAISLREGYYPLSRIVTLKSPQVWWPHDRGEQPLYTMKVKLRLGRRILDEVEVRFGVRTVEMKDLQLFVNGRPYFVRGTNYAPTDVFLSEVDREKIQADLELVKKANMNMIRVHAHVGHPELYELCDEMGILIWQDFPLQWNYSIQIMDKAVELIEKMALQLGNHPSVAVWVTHNEPFKMPRTYPLGPWEMTRLVGSFLFWTAMDVLDYWLKKSLFKIDESRPIIRASGLLAKLGGGTDTHIYLGWYLGKLSHVHRLLPIMKRNARFVTEFGAQAFPVEKNCRKFMNEELDKVDWRELERRYMYQPGLHDKYVGTGFENLTELVEASQNYQALVNKFYIETLRIHKYKPNYGILQFMFTDCSPGISWAIVDYWRDRKLAYYAVADSFEPLQVLFKHPGKPLPPHTPFTIELFAVNDTLESWQDIPVSIELKTDDGHTVLEEEIKVSFKSDMQAEPILKRSFTPSSEGIYRLLTRVNLVERQISNSHRIEIKQTKR